MKQNLKNTIILSVFMFVSIVYYEIIFKLRVLTFSFDNTFLRMVLFSIAYTALFMFVIKFFKEKGAKRMMFISVALVMFTYFNQEIYSSFVEGFYGLRLAGDFTLGLSFFSDYLNALRFAHILYFIPIILLYVANRYKLLTCEVSYEQLKTPLLFLGIYGLVFFIGLQTISEEIDEELDLGYSEMDLYTYMYNSQDAIKEFGLLTYTQRDFFSMFREDPLTEHEYKVLLDDYFQNQQGHSSNTYSNLFRNKNFIMIMAESLDTYAINEELTPNLYKLKTEYAYFENYYSPLYYRSTADTEFLVQTSIYPDKNVTLSMESYLDNDFRYTLPKMFSSRGYNTYSFHNYTDYFYPRTDFHLNTLGYDQYWGSEEMGMLDNPPEGAIINNHEWQSDLEMMEMAVPKFINDSYFYVNMLTVSGHFRYDDEHNIALKHQATVEQYEIDNGIELPEEIFWYLAANIELDLAIGHLLEELETHGRMDDTVIMIFGDHYAYGIDEETIWEYDDIKDDFSESDLHNVPMIIVSDSYMLDEPMTEYMSSIDILPTVSNLFGLSLDYRYVFGKDALGNGENIVRFADMSFVADKYSFDSLTEEFDIADEIITPEYLFQLNMDFVNDYKYNVIFLQYDYFQEEKEDEE